MSAIATAFAILTGAQIITLGLIIACIVEERRYRRLKG